MICPACGSRNPRMARVCGTCGTVMSEVPKTQFRYEQGLLDKRQTTAQGKTRTLSIGALALGLASLTPATFLTGIPAIILSIIALSKHRPGRRMAYTGLVTGAFGTLVLTFVMLLPIIAWQRELHRVAVVEQNMRAYQAALDDYATQNNGRYPKEGISWEREDDEGMVLHFKGRGQLLASGASRKSGEVDALRLHYRDEDRPLTGIPFNPYTRDRYRVGKDFFYLPESLAETGLNTVVDRTDSRCPFVGLTAPGGVPGTIVIVGWSPPEHHGSPIEYAIAGYGRNTAEPLSRGRDFSVLHN
jgi:hypothetical protein